MGSLRTSSHELMELLPFLFQMGATPSPLVQFFFCGTAAFPLTLITSLGVQPCRCAGRICSTPAKSVIPKRSAVVLTGFFVRRKQSVDSCPDCIVTQVLTIRIPEVDTPVLLL